MPPDAGVRVVTVNTWKGDGPYAARLAALAEQLAEIDADVVALQEAVATADGTVSTAGHLASALRLHLTSHPTRRKVRTIEGRSFDSWSELTVLSRWPVLEVEAVALPDDPADGERAALFVSLDTPGGVVRLANTHPTHLRERADLRREQLATIVARDFLDRPATARLLCGDLNAARDSLEIGWLCGWAAGWQVVDGYEAGGGRLPGATMSPRNPHVDPRVNEQAIDHIFSLARAASQQPSFTGTAIALDRPSGGVYPSDHFGVAVTLHR